MLEAEQVSVRDQNFRFSIVESRFHQNLYKNTCLAVMREAFTDTTIFRSGSLCSLCADVKGVRELEDQISSIYENQS